MVDGLVYLSTSLSQVAALDAGTGEMVWSYDPRTYDRLERPGNMGWQHRGVSYWEDDDSDDEDFIPYIYIAMIMSMCTLVYSAFGTFGTFSRFN